MIPHTLTLSDRVQKDTTGVTSSLIYRGMTGNMKGIIMRYALVKLILNVILGPDQADIFHGCNHSLIINMQLLQDTIIHTSNSQDKT